MQKNHDIEREARRRAGMKMGWFVHAGVYVSVNLLLAGLAALSGRNWAIYPALGWGLGLAIHGLVVLLAGGNVMQRMIERERRQLADKREPW